MAVVVLTNAQRDQFEAHINELRAMSGDDSAAYVANRGIGHYEVFAANLPGGLTGFDCTIEEGPELSVPELSACRGRVNAMASVLGDEIAADVANECLWLYEEKDMGVAGNPLNRDVTQTQFPRT